jgi:hypothetical protein
MRLKRFVLGARVAVSLFAVTLLGALASAELLIYHSLGETLEVSAVKAKYAGSLLVSAMHGSMYEYVTEDESIVIVEEWIAAGATQQGYDDGVKAVMEEDCTNCHSRSSTMTDAMPGMPLTRFEDVKKLTVRGLPGGKLLMQLHVHIFALGVIVLILSLLLAAADIGRLWQVLLPIVGFLGLWMDAAGWVLGSVGEWAVWLIMGGGGLLAAAIGLMSLLVLLDCWLRVPLLGRIPDPED